MNLNCSNQTKLYGLENNLKELFNLYKKKRLPNKILLSGQKGIGKATLAYHLINFILSKNEDFSYDQENFFINEDNRSFRLIRNGTNPNFNLIDVNDEKKNIDINQIRSLINVLNKSSLNSKPRFVLIDNIELLNINSINALLKIIEEPSKDIFFILINNNKKILPTLTSRCLNFKLSLSNKTSMEVTMKLLDNNLENIINKDLLNYYWTPGKIYHLLKFSKENNINLLELDLKRLISLLIDNPLYKKDVKAKKILYDFIEIFLIKNASLNFHFSHYFLYRIKNIKKFNLDDESLFIEFRYKLLNG
ncbi:AAA family ATPase [Pelagibacterales bacterium SAG-MED39]|nr:AAA family ATPase [Pelagibacterales bacterium SAG-MED39]